MDKKSRTAEIGKLSKVRIVVSFRECGSDKARRVFGTYLDAAHAAAVWVDRAALPVAGRRLDAREEF